MELVKIISTGIYLEWMSRFDARISGISNEIITRFLTKNEFKEFLTITKHDSKTRFLASHWAAKEAIYKALGVKNGPLNAIEISRLPNGHLTYEAKNDNTYGILNITYSQDFVAAACVLFQAVKKPKPHYYDGFENDYYEYSPKKEEHDEYHSFTRKVTDHFDSKEVQQTINKLLDNISHFAKDTHSKISKLSQDLSQLQKNKTNPYPPRYLHDKHTSYDNSSTTYDHKDYLTKRLFSDDEYEEFSKDKKQRQDY